VVSLACLVDQSNLLINQKTVTDHIAEKYGDYFCADLVDAFLDISASSLFWFTLVRVLKVSKM
jgi:hypothetical protein